MMKHALTALASIILVAVPTASIAAGRPVKTIEKIWYWYYPPDQGTVIGTTTFYCDGSTSGTGFVTGDYYEDYFGC